MHWLPWQMRQPCGPTLRHAHGGMLQEDCSCPLHPSLLQILAVRENAAEACATQCHSEVDRLITPIDEQETTQERHKHQEAYDLCYSKCVASETEQVAREREQVRPVTDLLVGSMLCCDKQCVADLGDLPAMQFKKSEEAFEKEVEATVQTNRTG